MHVTEAPGRRFLHFRGVLEGLRASWMTDSMELLQILFSTIHTLTLLLLRLCFTPLNATIIPTGVV